MGRDYAEWNGGDLYYEAFYQMEAAYHMAMAQQPPNVILAFRILRQIYDRVACFLDDKKEAAIEAQLKHIQSLLYDLESVNYAWIPVVKAKIVDNRNEAINLLSQAQRSLYEAMHEKKMLIPFGRTTNPGYGNIGPGGVMQ